MNEQQKKEILPNCNKCDHSYMGYFESSSCYSLKCSVYERECSKELRTGCEKFEDKASEIVALREKLEAEKAKAEKLKKCVEFYATLEHNDVVQSVEYDGQSFFVCTDDISTEVWRGKDHNGVERSHTGEYYGKRARETLKEIEAQNA